MHVSGAALVAAFAAGANAKAMVFRPNGPAATPVFRRAASRSASSSSVSIVTTVPLSSSATSSSSTGVWSTASPAPFEYGTPSNTYWGVQGRGKNGPTNPQTPSLNTPVNQSSESRLATLNGVDDWCTFAPEPLNNTQTMGYLEATTVAYCTKPRNNARVIPDGTVTAVQFVKTPLYIQLSALGDFTKINMAPGDMGGELDPHGATNMGNPVGGNVTSNVVDGKTDVFYEEWMNYISTTQICFRVCIAGSDKVTPSEECQHTLDEMGCGFVMAQTQINNGTFESCESDSAYPPGIYPQPDGSTSTFEQYYSGVYTVGATAYEYQNAQSDQVTPSAPYSYPTPSSCTAASSVSNGLKGIDYVAPPASSASSSSAAKSSSAGSGSAAASSGAAVGSSSSGPSASSATSPATGTRSVLGGVLALGSALVAGLTLL